MKEEEKMIYAGSTMFHECGAEDHARCKAIDLIDEKRGAYATCACTCHEAVECAAFDGERGAWKDRYQARRNEFFATIEALAKAQAISLGAKAPCVHEPGPMSCLVYHGEGVPACRACKKCGQWIDHGHQREAIGLGGKP